jgi:hypothetical protein
MRRAFSRPFRQAWAWRELYKVIHYLETTASKPIAFRSDLAFESVSVSA